MVLTSLSVAALGLGLCLPDTSAVGRFLFCTLLGAEEAGPGHGTSGTVFWCPSPAPQPPPRVPHHAVVARLGRCRFFRRALRSSLRVARLPTARRNFPVGCGWRLRPVSGPAICTWRFARRLPPLPNWKWSNSTGPQEARIKTAQLLPYGTRLDLKLAAAAEEPTNVLLQFSARTPPGGTP